MSTVDKLRNERSQEKVFWKTGDTEAEECMVVFMVSEENSRSAGQMGKLGPDCRDEHHLVDS